MLWKSTYEFHGVTKVVYQDCYDRRSSWKKINVETKIVVLLLACTLLLVGCGIKEINAKENEYELEFSPNYYTKSGTYGGDKIIFYFEDDNEFKSITVQNGMVTITNRDESLMTISGNFIIELVKGE